MNEGTQVPIQQSKRDFLKYLLGGSVFAWLASVLYPIVLYLKPPKHVEVEVKSVKAGKLSEIEKGTGTIVKFGTKPVILVHTPAGELRAFSAICTHLDCTVQYRNDMGLIWCACHNGKYDLNGRNTAGPPPRPLEQFDVIVQGEEILIAQRKRT